MNLQLGSGEAELDLQPRGPVLRIHASHGRLLELRRQLVRDRLEVPWMGPSLEAVQQGVVREPAAGAQEDCGHGGLLLEERPEEGGVAVLVRLVRVGLELDQQLRRRLGARRADVAVRRHEHQGREVALAAAADLRQLRELRPQAAAERAGVRAEVCQKTPAEREVRAPLEVVRLVQLQEEQRSCGALLQSGPLLLATRCLHSLQLCVRVGHPLVQVQQQALDGSCCLRGADLLLSFIQLVLGPGTEAQLQAEPERQRPFPSLSCCLQGSGQRTNNGRSPCRRQQLQSSDVARPKGAVLVLQSRLWTVQRVHASSQQQFHGLRLLALQRCPQRVALLLPLLQSPEARARGESRSQRVRVGQLVGPAALQNAPEHLRGSTSFGCGPLVLAISLLQRLANCRARAACARAAGAPDEGGGHALLAALAGLELGGGGQGLLCLTKL
mmetsp:Transcript_52323/g.152080  ORF Transcript_52323/g.152080 Transcript_52323/m.152080 type:complete len:442 (+) Transcript_52323:484-1809(+)